MYLKVLRNHGIDANDVISFAYNCELTWARDGNWIPFQEVNCFGLLLYVQLKKKDYVLSLLNQASQNIETISVGSIRSMNVEASPQVRWPDAKCVTLLTSQKSYLLFFKHSDKSQYRHAKYG